MQEQFDAIVIGTGQAGPALAVRLAKAGKKVAIIERKLVGGTCVNVGCTPTKTLVASARAAHVARHAAEYGVVIDGAIRVDMQKVMARMKVVVATSNQGVTTWLTSTPNVTLIEGHARFASANTVDVNGRTLTAPQIFINTGGRATVPNIPGLSSVPYLTNTGILELDTLPDHLLIIGGSYIGLEFAQIFRRLGSQVTVIEAGARLIAREDEAVSQAVQQMLEAEGIRFHLHADNLQLVRRGAAIALTTDQDNKVHEVVGSHLLLAVGRMPNSDDLGLDKAGIATDARGFITVDDQLRTNVPHVWALGDVNARGAFTHTAYNDYEIVAANLLDNDPRRVGDRITAYALFTDPPMARVGLSEAEVRKRGRPALIGSLPMSRVGRARERGETQGFMSVLVDASDHTILGAMLFGIEADEVIHSLLDLMYAKVPYTVMLQATHIHPTVSELLPTLLGELKPFM